MSLLFTISLANWLKRKPLFRRKNESSILHGYSEVTAVQFKKCQNISETGVVLTDDLA